MIRIIRVVLIAIVLFALPLAVSAASEAAGAEGAGHGGPSLMEPDPGGAIWTIVLFVLLVAVLGKFAWPPILRGLQEREQKIRGDLENAEKAESTA